MQSLAQLRLDSTDINVHRGNSYEGNMNRRNFIKQSLFAASALGLKFYTGIPQGLSAQPLTTMGARSKLVVIFLRGGVDMLSLFPPMWFGQRSNLSEHPLFELRRSDFLYTSKQSDNPGDLTLESGEALHIPGYPVSFHPGFREMAALLRRPDCAVITHTGSLAPGRSHFDQMQSIESGSQTGAKYNSGVLGRAWSVMSGRNYPIALGDALPHFLAGVDTALLKDASDIFGISSAASGRLRTTDAWRQSILERIDLFNPEPSTCSPEPNCDRYHSLTRRTKEQFGLLERDLENYTKPSGSAFRALCALAAQLTHGESNPPIMTFSLPGWDTHQNQNPQIPTSVFSRKVRDLAVGLNTLYSNMDTQNTLVVVMSEFGRTVRVNSVLGTDHGVGSAMMLFGAGVNRQNILRWGDFPTLVSKGWDLSSFVTGGGNQQSAALTIKHNILEILAECLQNHLLVDLSQQHRLRDSSIQNIFEGFTAIAQRRIF